MSHEVTMTFPYGNYWVVVPSVINGKKHTEQQTFRKFLSGEIKPFGVFSTQQNADIYAQLRSKGLMKDTFIEPQVKKDYMYQLQKKFGMFMDSDVMGNMQREQLNEQMIKNMPQKMFRSDDLEAMGFFKPTMPENENLMTPGGRRIRGIPPVEKQTSFDTFDYQNPFPDTVER